MVRTVTQLNEILCHHPYIKVEILHLFKKSLYEHKLHIMLSNNHCRDFASARTPLLKLPLNQRPLQTSAKFTSKLWLRKPLVFLLLWQFSVNLSFSAVLSPSSYVKSSSPGFSLLLGLLTGIIFLLSPLVGFLADIKFGQYKVLLFSTFVVLLSTIIAALTIGSSLLIHDYNDTFHLFVALLFIGQFGLCCGNMVFLTNILQFATSQLRDAPTDHSVAYLHASYWCISASSVIALTWNIPGHQFDVYPPDKTVKFDILQSLILTSIYSISALLLITVIYVLIKRKHWFLTDKYFSNSYKLSLGIARYTWHTNKPQNRSAFTYNEDVKLSRLDYGKKRYGGPFTTENIENIKVLLQIIKILLSVCPFFLLHTAITFSLLSRIHSRSYEKIEENIKVMILDYGMLSPLLKLLFIPTYYILIKPYFARYLPSMFKKMGIAMFMTCTSLLVFLLSDIFNYTKNANPQFPCVQGNSTYLINRHFFSVPSTYMFILHHTLSSLSETLLYITIWEFMCSQSPQDMKGMVFGIFYAIQGFYQFFQTALSVPFFSPWSIDAISCRSMFYILNLMIGLLTLTIYVCLAKTYKYRKRDDIYNPHEPALKYWFP